MRSEYKFLVSNDCLDGLRADLQPYLNADEHALAREVREYTVRSIYFDTLNFDFYREKIEGLRVRKKLRIRGYNQPDGDSTVFLEIKRKYENFIAKDRAPVRYSNLDRLIQSADVDAYVQHDNGYADSLVGANKFLFHLRNKSLRPTVLVTYDREAFLCKFNRNLRITFDKNLRSIAFPSLTNLYNDGDLRPTMRQHFILELKFYGGYPNWLRHVVERYSLTRSALSKYTICLDASSLGRPQIRSRHSILQPTFGHPN